MNPYPKAGGYVYTDSSALPGTGIADLPTTTFGPLERYVATADVEVGADGVRRIVAVNDNTRPVAPATRRSPAQIVADTYARWPEMMGALQESESADATRGPYIGTLTGRFYPFDPRPEDVDIVHIAHSLAMTCRYTGSCIRFYSTAEHSVHIARWLLPRYGAVIAWCGLLHDAPEALSGFGDTARPSKQKAPIIKETEERIWFHAVSVKYRLPMELPDEVHEADSRIIADEMQQNMREVDPNYINPLGIRLEYWSPERAEKEFLSAFENLQNMRAAA